LLVFSRILIANRGEIACRIIGTCRRLGIHSVAVFSEADAGAPHVKLADQALGIGAAPAADSYLNRAALLRALEQSGADALHPGYGFFSESAVFAKAVEQTGRKFIGPSSSALAFLSDKVRARERATQLGLPPVPGVDCPTEAACAESWLARADSLGWPLLIKAAAGGGGIGMKRVDGPQELVEAVEQAARGAARSFGDGRIYLERYLERAHHVELQLVRSASGYCRILGSRECSVQRRFQKIIEECPSPTYEALPAWRQDELRAFAQALLESVDYAGVATLEMLVDDRANVYFLEVNARLQVEHTITEQVFGVDLVEEQLRIACGDDVTESLKHAVARGHAVEARVYAEAPARGFIPQPGLVEALELPHRDDVRVDCGIERGTQVSPHYDPLLAKISAWGAHRREATDTLLQALNATRITMRGRQGLRENNLPLLKQLLQLPEWVAATYDTRTVDRALHAALQHVANQKLAASTTIGG
jgi:acetyl-CoA carboxylase biotin carboxylase subunit/3-methylcrotonyl-CoA carboxylase alpha subunit